MYFISFNMGLLKSNRIYAYPHFLDKIIDDGDVCIDLGANLGYFSVLFSKIVGESGKVHSVEPVKPILSVLRKNTRACKNVTIHPYALGTENKKIKLGNNSVTKRGFIESGSHFVLEDNSNAETEFDAEMRSGKELFANLDKLDFIKCDVEGYEEIVIPELEELIMKFEPMLLLETWNEARTNMLKFFHERNFESYILIDGWLHPSGDIHNRDILFIPKSRLKRVSKYLAK